MSGFRQLSRLYGVVAPRVQSLVARDIVRLVDDLFDAAILSWYASGWQRFDDLEANCTIQIFRCAQDAARQHSALRILSIELEWYQPSPAQLAGVESSVGMRRPDLRVSVGSVGMLAECKRLAAAGPLPKAYVDDGMARFVNNAYRTDTGSAVMIGYVLSGTIEAALPTINGHVDAHAEMGTSHRLGAAAPATPHVARFHSVHARSGANDIVLNHYLCPLADT